MKKLFILTTLFLLIGTNTMAEEQTIETATFAGGCFWCIESDFDKINGILTTISGYTGGHIDNPTYKQVSAGGTGHTEAIQVTFNTKIISYEELLKVFWKNIDPTVKDRQFCDIGNQYRSEIFYHSEQQKALAEKSKSTLPFKKIYTEITSASTFYPAEEYHQNYYKKNPIRYKYYRYSCGRDDRLKELKKSFK